MQATSGHYVVEMAYPSGQATITKSVRGVPHKIALARMNAGFLDLSEGNVPSRVLRELTSGLEKQILAL